MQVSEPLTPHHSLPDPLEAPAATVNPQSPSDRARFWRVFVSTFGAIFLAELGDKTQVAILLMSADSGQPWVVFLGAGTALIATSLVGVWVGQWLSKHVSPRTLDTVAGAMLLGITVWLLWDVVTV